MASQSPLPALLGVAFPVGTVALVVAILIGTGGGFTGKSSSTATSTGNSTTTPAGGSGGMASSGTTANGSAASGNMNSAGSNPADGSLMSSGPSNTPASGGGTVGGAGVTGKAKPGGNAGTAASAATGNTTSAAGLNAAGNSASGAAATSTGRSGTSATAAAPGTSAVSSTIVSAKQGIAVYSANCQGCHGPAGAGVAGAFPPLAGNAAVQGDQTYVADVLLYGLQGQINVNGQPYNGVMPAWAQKLSDQDIAAVTSYIRGAWGNKAAPISADTVKTERGTPKTVAQVLAERPK